MKTNNKQFASNYAEIIRLTDLEMYSRAHTEVKRAFNNNLSLDYDLLKTVSVKEFASYFNNIHDAETFFIAGEILKYSAIINSNFDTNEDISKTKEKALFLFIQAFSANDPRISAVAEMSLCEITSTIDIQALPEFLFTKLEVLNIQCAHVTAHSEIAVEV